MLSAVARWLNVPTLPPRLDPRHLRRVELQAVLELDAREPTPPHIAKALDFWRMGTLEPGQRPIGQAAPDAETIDEFIRNRTLGAWDWVEPYEKNGQRAWCGHFAAACFGESMPIETRKVALASTYRLHAYGADHGIKRLAPADARPGDILVVKNASGGKWYGDHVTLVERVDPAAGLIHTIEGNARGWVVGAPKGSATHTREGVIRRTRPIGRPSRARCPVSGLRQTAGAFAVYRWTVRP